MGIPRLGDAAPIAVLLIAGAAAVQIGTANFYDPTASTRIVAQLPEAFACLGASRLADVIATLQT